MLAFTCVACDRYQACGWDESLALGATYGVDIVEAYALESSTVRYEEEFDLTTSHPSCAMLDDVTPGSTLDLRLTQAPHAGSRCSEWFGEIPGVDLGARHPVIFGSTGYNLITVSGRRDFGDGCSGIWEFDVHMPSTAMTDPFRAADPFEIPVTLVYRYFIASAGAEEACMARSGVSTLSDEGVFRCEDAFVSQMSRP
ncbi:hypothetical protein [Sandaracinus amylolyticus]|uniref:hypothetical protein n=1 Tax=Sandaracinus amylolyticus TaxID=927083 RepID=UPI001F2AC2F2|nr:hypothetical protein [Sandaracinus amylolyticus]